MEEFLIRKCMILPDLTGFPMSYPVLLTKKHMEIGVA